MLSSITSVSPTHHTGVLLHLGRRGCDRDGYLETQHDRLCDGQQGRRQGPRHQHHGHQAFHHLVEGARVSVKNHDHVFHIKEMEYQGLTNSNATIIYTRAKEGLSEIYKTLLETYFI